MAETITKPFNEKTLEPKQPVRPTEQERIKQQTHQHDQLAFKGDR